MAFLQTAHLFGMLNGQPGDRFHLRPFNRLLPESCFRQSKEVLADNEEIKRSLSRLEGKLDILITEIKQHFDDDKTNFSSIDTRIQKVEKKIYYASGFVAALALILQQFRTYIFPSG